MIDDEWVDNDPRAGQPLEPEGAVASGIRRARADAVIARRAREGLRDKQSAEVTEAVRRMLDEFGLNADIADQADALVCIICRVREAPTQPVRALASRERRQALAGARSLLRHMEKPPRRPGTTEHKREILIRSLDSLNAVVKLAATSGFNVTHVLDRLRTGAYDGDDLAVLIRALEAIPPGEGACPPEANYRPLLRAGILSWRASGRRISYTLDQYADPPSLNGPLPDFLRALLVLSHVCVPGDGTLHKHLRALKNV